jgi:hypothetical protein
MKNTKCRVVKFVLTFLILSSWAINSYAQFDRPYVPPSPNAAALIKYANIEVGHYTGIPNITIPLGVLPGKDIAIPVSLSYHASGIKVQDVASSVGLGFNLNAGGAITRVVRGLPDGEKGNCASGPSSYWSNIYGNCDGERDVFYYSIMGRSGQMFLDDAGQIQTMPYQDIQITHGIGTSSLGYWTITDESGYKYYFGENAAERESSTYYVGNTTYTEKSTYVSTWYLNRIVSPKGEQVATFNYSAGTDFEFLMYHQQGTQPSGGTLSISTVNNKIKINQPKYISTISTTLATVQFNYLNNRTDLPNGWQINTVVFKDFDGAEKKKYYFNLDYFVGEFSAPGQRLRLTSIKEGVRNPVLLHSFTYYESTPPANGYSSNPNRNNFESDHYGYYNHAANASGGTNTCLPNNRLPVSCHALGVSKMPSFVDAKFFSLIEIANQAGGRTVFEYESSNGRGLRIKSISNYSGTSLASKSSYTYSGAAGFSNPVYSYTTSNGSTVWASSSFKDLYDLNGTNIGYSSVTETFLDGSKIVREFTNFNDYPDNTPSVVKWIAAPPASTPVFISNEDVNGPPFAPYSTRFWMRGLPKSTQVFDDQGNPLSREEMDYQEGNTIASVKNVTLHRFEQTGGSNPSITYLSGLYELYSRPVYLTQIRRYEYDRSDISKSIKETTDFSYHPTLKTFPTSITKKTGTASGVPETKVTYRYPVDIAGTGAEPTTGFDEAAGGVWALVKWHVITPLEQLAHYKDFNASTFKIIDGQLFTFRRSNSTNSNFTGRPLLSGVYTLDTDAGLTGLSTQTALTNSGKTFTYDNSKFRQLSTLSYDESTSNISSWNSYAGVASSYTWGYNNSLITSETISSANLQFQKQYTYNTINGVDKIIDANGLPSFYEYDDLGRVKIIKDRNGDIITRYRYNAQNQSGLSANFNVAGSNPKATPVSFQATGGTDVGITKYIWDFGDGVVSESQSMNITHTYSQTGTFTVKLVVTNPEYGTVSTSKSVVIY